MYRIREIRLLLHSLYEQTKLKSLVKQVISKFNQSMSMAEGQKRVGE